MRNDSKRISRVGREGFALQIVLPICLLLIGTAAMAVMASYQMRINATRTAIQSNALQMQTATMRQAAFVIATDLANTNFNTFSNDLYAAYNQGTTNLTGNLNQGAAYQATLINVSTGATNSITNDFISSLPFAYTTNSYPETRLALVKPGSTFIAKVFPYELITSYSQNDNLSTNGGTVLNAAMTLKTNSITIYEVPSQFGLEGGNITLSNGATSTVLGSSVNVQGGSVSGNVIGDTNVSYGAGVSINGSTLNQASSSNAGQAEKLANTASSGFTGQFAVGQQGGAAVLMQIGDRSMDYDSVGGVTNLVPKIFERPVPVATGQQPSLWDVYSHPYYSTYTRVYSANGSPLDPIAGGTIICRQAPGGGNGLAGVGGTLAQRTNEVNGSYASFMTITNQPGSCAPTGQALVAEISVTNIPIDPINGGRTLFIDLQTAAGDNGHTRMGTIVGLVNANDMGNVPLSIISANPIAFLGDFNQTNSAPASILAPVIYSSLTTATAQGVNLTGIRASSAHTGNLNLNTLGSTNAHAATVSSFSSTDITNTSSLPPISLKNWLIVSTPPQ